MGGLLKYVKRSWKLWAVAIGILALGVSTGMLLGNDTRTKLASARESLAAVEDQRESLDQTAADLESDLSNMRLANGGLESELASLTEKYERVKARSDSLKRQLERKKAEFSSKLDGIQQKEKGLEALQAEVAAKGRKLERQLHRIRTTSFDDGVWNVGSDITPGIYRSPGGSMCYWAILGSADTSDITNNGGFNRNQSVTLTAGSWFETSDCGEWTMIGLRGTEG